MGKKLIDFKMQRVASRGRKSKAGGGGKSKATQSYTPLLLGPICLMVNSRRPIYIEPDLFSFFFSKNACKTGKRRIVVFCL